MNFNTSSFLIPSKSDENIVFDNIKSSQYSNIFRSGIEINTPIMVNSNIYNIAYIDTNFYNSELKRFFI